MYRAGPRHLPTREPCPGPQGTGQRRGQLHVPSVSEATCCRSPRARAALRDTGTRSPARRPLRGAGPRLPPAQRARAAASLLPPTGPSPGTGGEPWAPPTLQLPLCLLKPKLGVRFKDAAQGRRRQSHQSPGPWPPSLPWATKPLPSWTSVLSPVTAAALARGRGRWHGEASVLAATGRAPGEHRPPASPQRAAQGAASAEGREGAMAVPGARVRKRTLGDPASPLHGSPGEGTRRRAPGQDPWGDGETRAHR